MSYKNIKDVKFYGNGAEAATVADTGTILSCTAVPSGATNSDRVGNRIQPLYLRYRLNCEAGDNFNVLRMVIFRSKGGPQTSVAGLFQGAVANVNDLMDYNKVQVLVDKTATLLKQEAAAGTFVSRPIVLQGIVKIPFMIEYESASTAQAQRNAVQMLVISDSSAPAHPTADWATQLVYRDM